MIDLQKNFPTSRTQRLARQSLWAFRLGKTGASIERFNLREGGRGDDSGGRKENSRSRSNNRLRFVTRPKSGAEDRIEQDGRPHAARPQTTREECDCIRNERMEGSKARSKRRRRQRPISASLHGVKSPIRILRYQFRSHVGTSMHNRRVLISDSATTIF